MRTSPTPTVPITNIVSGTVNGGTDFEFYATSNDPSATNVPGTYTGGDGANEQAPDTTWSELFFPDGTDFGRMRELNWSYTYTAPGTCEQWVDAYNNDHGSTDSPGNITGINACT